MRKLKKKIHKIQINKNKKSARQKCDMMEKVDKGNKRYVKLSRALPLTLQTSIRLPDPKERVSEPDSEISAPAQNHKHKTTSAVSNPEGRCSHRY